MKKISIRSFYLAIVILFVACGSPEEMDESQIKRLPQLVEIKDMLLKNKSILAKNMAPIRDSIPYFNQKGVILLANRHYFESQVIARNKEIETDLRALEKCWGPDEPNWVTLRDNDEIDFGVKFYNYGQFDSYHHSILYCPNADTAAIKQRYETVVLLKDIDKDWKYLIVKTRF